MYHPLVYYINITIRYDQNKPFSDLTNFNLVWSRTFWLKARAHKNLFLVMDLSLAWKAISLANLLYTMVSRRSFCNYWSMILSLSVYQCDYQATIQSWIERDVSIIYSSFCQNMIPNNWLQGVIAILSKLGLVIEPYSKQEIKENIIHNNTYTYINNNTYNNI